MPGQASISLAPPELAGPHAMNLREQPPGTPEEPFLFPIRQDSENWLSTDFRGLGRPAKTDRSISDTAARHYPRSTNERGRPPPADWLAPLCGPTWRDKLIPRWSRGDASSARNLIVMAGRIGNPRRRSPVGAPGRGVGRPILRCATAATYPDAHTNWRAPTKYFGLSLTIASTAAVYLFVGLLALLAAHLAEVQGSSSQR